MKKIIPALKILAKLLVILVVLGITIQIVGEVVSPARKNRRSWEIPDRDAVDVAFLGSSHTYMSVIPQKLFDDTGITSINITLPGLSVEGSYWLLREFLYSQNPKVVVVDSLFNVSEDINIRAIQNLPVYSPTKYEAIWAYEKEYSGPNDIDRFSYFQFFLGRNRLNLNKEDFLYYEQQGQDLYTKGYRPSVTVIDEESVAHKTVTEEKRVDYEARWQTVRQYLDKLRALEEQHGFTLIMSSAPHFEDDEMVLLDEYTRGYCEENGIPYVNMNEAVPNLDPTTDFVDQTHTNCFGARKVTDCLADYLTATGLLEDHRGDARYSYWDNYMGNYVADEAALLLSEEQSVTKYFELLSQLDERFVVLIYARNPSGKTVTRDSLVEGMNKMGLALEGGEVLTGPYLAIWNNGDVIEQYGVLDQEIYRNFNGTSVMLKALSFGNALEVEELEDQDEGLATEQLRSKWQTYAYIDGTLVGRNREGLNIVVYEPYRDKQVDSRIIRYHRKTAVY